MKECYRSRMLCALLLMMLPGLRPGHAAFERQPWGGAATSTGGSHLIVWEDPWASLEHPELACMHPAPIVTACLHPGAFGLDELRRTGLAAAIPLRWGGIVGGATVYGFELYRELSLALGGALVATHAIALGVGFRWQHLMISGYGSTSALSLDAGLLIGLTDEVRSTVTLSNLLSSPLGGDMERPPREIRMGLVAELSRHLRVGIEWFGDRRYPLGFTAGMEYRPLPPLALRCGLSTEPPEYAAGIGIRLAWFTLDYGLVFHVLLGATHAISLSAPLA